MNRKRWNEITPEQLNKQQTRIIPHESNLPKRSNWNEIFCLSVWLLCVLSSRRSFVKRFYSVSDNDNDDVDVDSSSGGNLHYFEKTSGTRSDFEAIKMIRINLMRQTLTCNCQFRPNYINRRHSE